MSVITVAVRSVVNEERLCGFTLDKPPSLYQIPKLKGFLCFSVSDFSQIVLELPLVEGLRLQLSFLSVAQFSDLFTHLLAEGMSDT